MKIASSISLKKLFGSRRFKALFSIIGAFVFWLVITINQNPIRQQTFADVPISISLENTVAGEKGMNIISDLSSQKFTVTVSGPNYIVSSLKTSDFSIYASAAEITEPGEYELEVLGNKNTAKGNYDFVGISPEKIKVKFDYIDTKQFNVEPSLVGVGAADGFVAETPVVTATEGDMVSISGPRSIVGKIARVIAYAQVDETLNSSKTYDAEVKALDSEGKEISAKNLTISSVKVKVAVPISKKATVKVDASFINLPVGYKVSDIKHTINHKEITIIGAADVIDTVKSIKLSDIDFTTVSPESNKFDVSAILPDGVKILDNIEFFTVSIDVSDYEIKTFNTVTGVKTEGLKNGLSVKKTASILNVKICVPKELAKDIKSKDIYAIIDLSGKSAGEHTVPVKIVSDTYKGIWQIGAYTTAVTIN